MDDIRLKCLRSSFTYFDFTLTLALTLTFSICLNIHIPPSVPYFLLGHKLIPIIIVVTYYTQLKLAGKKGFIGELPSLIEVTEGLYPIILVFIDHLTLPKRPKDYFRVSFFIMEFSVKSYVIGALD